MQKAVVLLAAGLLACGTAWGALDTSNAYTDDSSYTWAGSNTFTNGDLSAQIDWVVNDRVMHEGELQFQYVYQVTSKGEAAVTLLSVNMLESNEANDIDVFQTAAGDVAPTDAFFAGPSNLRTANWTFAGLDTDEVSYALEYWSVNEPLLWGAMIQNSGDLAGGMLPSPSDVIPEPATLALVVLGGLGVIARRRR